MNLLPPYKACLLAAYIICIHISSDDVSVFICWPLLFAFPESTGGEGASSDTGGVHHYHNLVRVQGVNQSSAVLIGLNCLIIPCVNGCPPPPPPPPPSTGCQGHTGLRAHLCSRLACESLPPSIRRGCGVCVWALPPMLAGGSCGLDHCQGVYHYACRLLAFRIVLIENTHKKLCCVHVHTHQ